MLFNDLRFLFIFTSDFRNLVLGYLMLHQLQIVFVVGAASKTLIPSF